MDMQERRFSSPVIILLNRNGGNYIHVEDFLERFIYRKKSYILYHLVNYISNIILNILPYQQYLFVLALLLKY